MISRPLITIVLSAALAAPLACTSSQTPPPAAPSDPLATELPADPEARVRDLGILVAQLASQTDQLPGRDEAEYRARLADGLEGLAQCLRLAQGPRMNGAFRVRLYAIRDAVRQLRETSVDRSVENTTTGALRAAHNAIAQIAADRLSGDPEVQQQIDALADAVRSLDRESGALYRVTASGAYRQAVQAMQTISERFAARVPTTAPTTQAAEAPSAG